jgi:hypothetical protein
MKLPAPPPKRRNETRSVTRPTEVRLNRIPGVRFARNNNLGPVVPYARRMEPGIKPVVAGLGTGSADLVGIVSVVVTPEMVGRTIGVAACLEAKMPGKTLEPDQARWAKVVRSLGGFCCLVRSVDEAIAAVARCRAGASE